MLNEHPFESIFTIRPADEYIDHARPVAVPRPLFDEVWREGEIAVLYGEAGVGKSFLAWTIAQAIARSGKWTVENGKSRGATPGKKVLYLDLELTDEQFRVRYSGGGRRGKRAVELKNGENGSLLTKNAAKNVFGEHLLRVAVDVGRVAAAGRVHKVFADGVRRMVAETGAEVVIIDSLARLRSSSQGTHEDLLLMRELDRLRRETGVSILIVTNSTRRDAGRPMELHHLHGSRIMSAYADSIFALVRSRVEPEIHYIKQAYSRNSEIVYDGPRVCEVQLTRTANFPAFKPAGHGDEQAHLTPPSVHQERQQMQRIVDLVDQGLTFRDIENQLGISKSAAQRKHLKARQMGFTVSRAEGRRTEEFLEPQVTPNPENFPTREIYAAIVNLPRYQMEDRDTSPQAATKRRELHLLGVAKRYAIRFWKTEGTPPEPIGLIDRIWESGMPENKPSIEGILAEYDLTVERFTEMCSTGQEVRLK